MNGGVARFRCRGAGLLDVIVELGSGSGKQAEILKRLYPHLTIILVDLAPQLYVAERFLHAVFPDDVVPYRITRECGPLDVQTAGIHFIGNHRIYDLKPHGRVLFWSAASMGEMEPDIVAHYGEAVSAIADWLFLCQAFTGKEPSSEVVHGGVLDPVVWDHYVAAFPDHEPIDRRRLWILAAPPSFDPQARPAELACFTVEFALPARRRRSIPMIKKLLLLVVLVALGALVAKKVREA